MDVNDVSTLRVCLNIIDPKPNNEPLERRRYVCVCVCVCVCGYRNLGERIDYRRKCIGLPVVAAYAIYTLITVLVVIIIAVAVPRLRVCVPTGGTASLPPDLFQTTLAYRNLQYR